MNREGLIDVLTEATANCRDSCGTLSSLWDNLGERGLISPTSPPEMQDIARRLFAQAKVMHGVCMELEEYMNGGKPS